MVQRGTRPTRSPLKPGASRRLPQVWRVDLGSSTLREPGWICVDINPSARPDIRADFNRLPLPFREGSIAQARATQVAEHLHVHLIDFLKEVHRILEPQGEFYLTVPNMFSLKNRLLYLVGRVQESREWSPHHVKLISPRYLTDLLRHIGFEPRYDYRRFPRLPFRPLLSGSLCIRARKRP